MTMLFRTSDLLLSASAPFSSQDSCTNLISTKNSCTTAISKHTAHFQLSKDCSEGTTDSLSYTSLSV